MAVFRLECWLFNSFMIQTGGGGHSRATAISPTKSLSCITSFFFACGFILSTRTQWRNWREFQTIEWHFCKKKQRKGLTSSSKGQYSTVNTTLRLGLSLVYVNEHWHPVKVYGKPVVTQEKLPCTKINVCDCFPHSWPLFWIIVKSQNVSCSETNSRCYYMALSHKDWELPNSRIWLAEMDIDRGLDFPI